MTKIIAGEAIAAALSYVRPTKIAVAYLGRDAHKFVDEEAIREIVVAPVIGTDPQEVRYLAGKIGWENIHLIERLHSKIYLGTHSAAFGSFNLSHNGLSGQMNLEAGVVTDDLHLRTELALLFEEYKREAGILSEDQKREILDKLQVRTNARQASGESEQEWQQESLSRQRSIEDYEPISDRDFYCTFYTYYGDYDLREDAFRENPEVAKVSAQAAQLKIENLTKDYLPFAESDNLEPNRWLLVWGADDKGRVDRRKTCSWLYIHVVQSQGTVTAVDGFYSKVVLQWKEAIKPAPLPPFELTDDVVRAIQIVVNSGKYPCFKIVNDEAWSINSTFPHFKNFILDVKEACRSLRSRRGSKEKGEPSDSSRLC